MHSSLPDFSSNPSANAAGNPLLNAAALGGLAAGGAPGANGDTPPADFSDLMAETEAGASLPTVQAVATTPTAGTLAAPNLRFTAGADASALAGEETAAPVESVAPAPDAAAAFVVTTDPLGRTPATGATETDIALTPPAGDSSDAASAEVSEEMREQAAAFVLTLFQTLLPEATPVLSGHSSTVLQNGTSTAGMPAGNGSARNAATDLAPTTAQAGQGSAASTPGNPAFTTWAQAEMAVAPDGAVEVSIALPSRKAGSAFAASNAATDDAADAISTSADATDASALMMEAELALPGQPVVRVQAHGFAPAPGTDAPAAVRPENFAARFQSAKTAATDENQSTELNFENALTQGVKAADAPAGIAVADEDFTMSAPIEEIRSSRRPQDPTILPARADFQVAQAPVERITAAASVPAGQSFAERAVETVTNLADAQFSVSMQRSGSVQLRLQFGGEDLSVRVALRDGAVHADFRTDSASLRAALEQEWQAVKAASPEQLQRFAEPVFGPASAGESRASSGQGEPFPQHARSQQPLADADDRSQQQRSARDADASAFFSRRSLVPETFVPEPAAAPRAPAFLPTSLRLSALA